MKLAGVSPFAVILFGQLVPSSLPEGYYLLIILFSNKSKQYIFNYLFPYEGERTAYKHHCFFIVELDNKSREYFMRKNRPLKFPSVPGGLCGFYKYLISLHCFNVWQLKGREEPRLVREVLISYSMEGYLYSVLQTLVGLHA